jgi:hypothetical protein
MRRSAYVAVMAAPGAPGDRRRCRSLERLGSMPSDSACQPARVLDAQHETIREKPIPRAFPNRNRDNNRDNPEDDGPDRRGPSPRWGRPDAGAFGVRRDQKPKATLGVSRAEHRCPAVHRGGELLGRPDNATHNVILGLSRLLSRLDSEMPVESAFPVLSRVGRPGLGRRLGEPCNAMLHISVRSAVDSRRQLVGLRNGASQLRDDSSRAQPDRQDQVITDTASASSRSEACSSSIEKAYNVLESPKHRSLQCPNAHPCRRT